MIAELIRNSKYTIVYTGAGMSTESGLPDFRSAKTGLWETEDPALIASTEAMNRDVERFFQFYRERVLGLKDCTPHNGHKILAEWERVGLIKGIITQNVDGFHSEAGSENVMELHGTLQTVHCGLVGKSLEAKCMKLKNSIVHVEGNYAHLSYCLGKDFQKRRL